MTQEKKKRLTKRSLPAEVKLAVEAGLAKKAEDVCLLDLRELSAFTDFFLIMNGSSSRQNAAVAEGIEVRLKAAGVRPLGVEGRESADWVLVDYGWFVVHVFSRGARDHYDLEKLWGDAPRLDF
ncbi:MAG: ribosome silencing factor [Candidatus Aminicenantes bacterium]|nr:ribosome silencing factor [Candidatus Aminicenantes bacterium]